MRKPVGATLPPRAGIRQCGYIVRLSVSSPHVAGSRTADSVWLPHPVVDRAMDAAAAKPGMVPGELPAGR
jgi:hypothetical protein